LCFFIIAFSFSLPFFVFEVRDDRTWFFNSSPPFWNFSPRIFRGLPLSRIRGIDGNFSFVFSFLSAVVEFRRALRPAIRPRGPDVFTPPRFFFLTRHPPRAFFYLPGVGAFVIVFFRHFKISLDTSPQFLEVGGYAPVLSGGTRLPLPGFAASPVDPVSFSSFPLPDSHSKADFTRSQANASRLVFFQPFFPSLILP